MAASRAVSLSNPLGRPILTAGVEFNVFPALIIQSSADLPWKEALDAPDLTVSGNWALAARFQPLGSDLDLNGKYIETCRLPK